MHAHNTAIKAGGKTIVRPIAASPLRMAPPVNLQPIGITPKARQQDNMAESWEVDISECEIDILNVSSVYKTSLCKLHLARSLASMKLTQLQNAVSKFKQFVAPMLSGSDSIPPNPDLQKRLSDNRLTYYPVARDGNCFFTALALKLASDCERWADRLVQAGISSEIATVL